VDITATKSEVSAQKKKLTSSLANPQFENDLTPQGIGVLDTFGTDISEVLNEGLHSSNTFYGMIPGAKQPGDILEISHVKVNKDCSHIMVYWSAPFITNFSKLVRAEKGEEEATRVHDKMAAAMTGRLQKREPQFRSLLIKKMEFRRVPRITFREWTKKVVDKMKQQRANRLL
jgi:ribosome-binding factor A